MDKYTKLHLLFGLMAFGYPPPSELEPEARVLIGLPKNLPGGGYDREDVKLGTVCALATLLSEKEG